MGLQNDAPDCPECFCNRATKVGTVKKVGPNLGRQYFTCQRGKKEFGGCGFIRWKPDHETGFQTPKPSHQLQPNSPEVPQTPKSQAPKVETTESAAAEPAAANSTPPRPAASASTLMSAYLTQC